MVRPPPGNVPRLWLFRKIWEPPCGPPVRLRLEALIRISPPATPAPKVSERICVLFVSCISTAGPMSIARGAPATGALALERMDESFMIRRPARMSTVPPAVAVLFAVAAITALFVMLICPSWVNWDTLMGPPPIVASPAEATLTTWTSPRGARSVAPVAEAGPVIWMLPPTTDKVRAKLLALYGTSRVGAVALPWIVIAAGVELRKPNDVGAAVLRFKSSLATEGTEYRLPGNPR